MITVGALARAMQAEAAGDLDLALAGPAEPAAARPDEIAVALAPKYAEALAQGSARAALLWPGADWRGFGLAAAVFAPRPRYAIAQLTRVFERPAEAPPGIHPTAVIDASAEIGKDAAIGPFVVIGPRARIGPGARIHPHVTIAEDAAIGADARLHAGVRIGARVRIGDRFIAQPGAVIGGDGFSFVTPKPGVVEEARATGLIAADSQEYVRINSLGAVVIGDDCEVGANACVDRGTIADTVIGDGTKLDNHVQVGHNVRIGRSCLICGHVAIGGSTIVGDRVVLGGKVAVADNIRIGSNSVAAGQAGIARDVPPNQIVMGSPAVKREQFHEMFKAMRRLPRLLARLDAAEKRVSNPPPNE